MSHIVAKFATNERTMDKSLLDCRKMPIHPYDPSFLTWVKANIPKLLERKLEGIETQSAARYVILMYHEKSPIHEMINLDWFARKFEAAEACKFKMVKERNKPARFAKEVEEALLGKNEAFNDMIIDFVSWYNSTTWTEFVFLQETLMKYIKEALGGGTGDKNSVKTVQDIYDRMTTLQRRLMLGEQDSEELIRRIYYRVEESRLAIRPEDYARRLLEGDQLKEDTPYGADYPVVQKLSFVGKTIPNVNTKKRS